MFLSNKPGVPPGINLLQKPNQKLSRPSGNLANPVIFSRKPGEDKDSTGSVTEGCYIGLKPAQAKYVMTVFNSNGTEYMN